MAGKSFWKEYWAASPKAREGFKAFGRAKRAANKAKRAKVDRMLAAATKGVKAPLPKGGPVKVAPYHRTTKSGHSVLVKGYNRSR